MGHPNSENLDQALVKALIELKKTPLLSNFSKERIDFIKNHPYKNNYPHLARRIIQIFLEYPELRIIPEGQSIQKVLFDCLKKVKPNEFQIAMNELRNFYSSDLYLEDIKTINHDFGWLNQNKSGTHSQASTFKQEANLTTRKNKGG